MECMEWLPEEIIKEEDFLCESLKILQAYVLQKRNEDISVQLYIYENRVLYSGNDTDVFTEFSKIIPEGIFQGDPISWEAIRTYPYAPGIPELPGIHDKVEEKCYVIGKRLVKTCFLRGWLEVGLWLRGEQKKQIVYCPPDSPEEIGISGQHRDLFFKGEYACFSLDLLKGYWAKYLKLNPAERPQKLRLTDPKQNLAKDEFWQVFVPSDLWKYYYGEDDETGNTFSADFPPYPKKMMTVKCPKNTDTRPAVIGNFISWQEYLHALNRKDRTVPPFSPDSCRKGTTSERRKDMKQEKNFVEQMEDLKSEAARDRRPVPDDIQEILRKIARKSGISGLHQNEREIMEKACKDSPKIRLFFRMAQIEHIRRKTAEYLAKSGAAELLQDSDEAEESVKPSVFSVLKDKIIESVTGFWTPFGAGQMITAAKVPEQKYNFVTDHGKIEVSCTWCGAYRNQPAFIRISWKAHISMACELAARFVNPESNEILCEISLGQYRTGTKTILQSELGFDPAKEKWAVSILLVSIEK
ncbi:MAG: hypothetical protein AB7S75_02955 [Desulfococcaceae bacterium]